MGEDLRGQRGYSIYGTQVTQQSQLISGTPEWDPKAATLLSLLPTLWWPGCPGLRD